MTVVDPKSVLEWLRLSRDFNVLTCLEKKSSLINSYFTDNRLDSVVLGKSGGVDSYVTMALLCFAAQMPGSPIKKVVGLRVPFYHSLGASTQAEAKNKGERGIQVLKEKFPNVAEGWLVPGDRTLDEAVNSLFLGANRERSYKTSPWAQGQMLSVMRTPFFYGAAALLQANGFRSVVSGTTNRDEGSSIGFFGKASDAMVDIQPISDLHKSEVYALAEFFDCPSEIVNDAPRGDVWDGRTDSEMIGAPYWAIELYTLLHEQEKPDWTLIETLWKDAEIKSFFTSLCNLRELNRHKYLVGNPAVHFDVYSRHLFGGWSEKNTFSFKPV